jgi:putative colanic acid biosysnthesis UDP-glucose lipid carrier transferase
MSGLKEGYQMGAREASARIESFPPLSSSTAAVAPYRRRSRRLLQNHDTLLQHAQIGLSMAASVIGLLILAWWRDGEIAPQYRTLGITSALIMLVIYEWRGVFRRFDGRGLLRICNSWLLVVALVLGLAFFTKTSENFSRLVVTGWIFLGYALQAVGYQLSYHFSQKIRAQYRRPVRTIVLGSTGIAQHLVASINKNVWMPDQVVGIVDDALTDVESWNMGQVRYLGTFRQITQIIESNNIDRVYIALPMSCSQMQVYKDIANSSVDVVWVPDIFNMPLLNHSVRELNGLPLITLSESPLMSESQLFCKSILDKTIAATALLLLSPLMLTIAFLVRRSSPGPIIFKQKRHGWDGRIIEVWKFRSMYMHDEKHVRQASRNDDRVTPIGRFIRRTSIDELPQLFNVLMGTMSLVGPRPHALAHNGFYSQYICSYMMRHRIKPGITGLAQVNGLRGETETLDKMLHRVEYDIDYINRWSIWLDMIILIKTPFSLFSRNAY